MSIWHLICQINAADQFWHHNSQRHVLPVSSPLLTPVSIYRLTDISNSIKTDMISAVQINRLSLLYYASLLNMKFRDMKNSFSIAANKYG